MVDVGDNLSGMQWLEFLSAASPEELRDQLRAIRTPYKIISMYAANATHYAWLLPTFHLRNKPGRKPKGDK